MSKALFILSILIIAAHLWIACNPTAFLHAIQPWMIVLWAIGSIIGAANDAHKLWSEADND